MYPRQRIESAIEYCTHPSRRRTHTKLLIKAIQGLERGGEGRRDSRARESERERERTIKLYIYIHTHIIYYNI